MLEFKGWFAVPSSTGRRVAFGAFERSVVVRDLVRGGCSAPMETTFDGGWRLALSDELDGIVAAAYHVHGLALYACSTGAELWRRRDLKKVQQVTLSRDGLTAFCGRECASLAVIDLRTGATLRAVRGVKALHDSPYDDVQFLDGTRPQLLDGAGKRRFFVPRTTFAFLDVSFAPGRLVLTEAGGPVRCVDLGTGEERWRYQPDGGRHVFRLGYREAEPSLLGVLRHRGGSRLLRWSLDGSIIDAVDLRDATDCCFGLAGEVVATADGRVLDAATGAIRPRKQPS